jgi:hypothetical protein
MQTKLPRYRWWLLTVCLAAVAVVVIGWLQLSGPHGREHYNRIRLGMTPAEVASSIGTGPSASKLIARAPGRGWDLEASEGPSFTFFDTTEAWADESVVSEVYYRNGKAVLKRMYVHVAPLKAKALDWLGWLCDRLGW